MKTSLFVLTEFTNVAHRHTAWRHRPCLHRAVKTMQVCVNLLLNNFTHHVHVVATKK